MFDEDLFPGPLVASLAVGISTIILLYWYVTKNHDHWKNLGVPYVKPIPFFGTTLHSLIKPFHEVENERYQKYGAIYGHYESSRPLLSVAEPDLMRDILVKDFHLFGNRRDFRTGDPVMDSMVSNIRGEDWKRVRNIITPTFTTGRIKRMMSIFNDCANTLMKNFEEMAKKETPVDCKRMYGAFTMDVIASSAFSTKIDSHNDPDNLFVRTARDIFRASWRFALLLLSPWLMKVLKIPFFPPSVTDFFKDVTMQIIAERTRTGQRRNDFLQFLLDTAKEATEEEKENPKRGDAPTDLTSNYGEEVARLNSFKSNVHNKRLSLDELVGNSVIFFIAGYETTAQTLAFASYLLALNEAEQDKLRKEIDTAIKESNGDLTYECVQNLKYLDNVISETLRIYSPAGRLERVSETDYQLGKTGITVQKGIIVTMPVQALHMDPAHFPEPEAFRPDRFTVEERSKRHQYAYLPFGAGPRNCLGMRFALSEIKVCLAHVIARFTIKRCPETKVPLEFHNGALVLQPKGIFVKLEKRKDCPLKTN